MLTPLEAGLAAGAAILAALWFQVTVVPLCYRLPRALWWAASGRASWKATAAVLAPPLLWNAGLALVAGGLPAYVPDAPAYLLTSAGFGFGIAIGLGTGIWRMIGTPQARRSLDRGFRQAVAAHLPAAETGPDDATEA